MTFKDQLFALYSAEERLLIEQNINSLGLPPNDIIFLSLIEARRATRAAQSAAETARVAEEKADQALSAAKGSVDTLARAVDYSLKEARGIQRELTGSGFLWKALLSKLGSALLTLAVFVTAFIFLQSRSNSQLQRYIGEEKKLTSSSNSAFVDNSVEIARRGNLNAAACYALASALSLPTIKAAWDPAQGAIIAFPSSSGVQVIQTNNQTNLIFPKSGSENFHKVLREIAEGGFLDLVKEANKVSTQIK